jgi:hypothetical protein
MNCLIDLNFYDFDKENEEFYYKIFRDLLG